MKKISRLVLKTEESLISDENKTEYNPRLTAFMSRADLIIDLTKQLIENTKLMVGPRKYNQKNDMEDLGYFMQESGRMVDQTRSSDYGLCLVQVGEFEERLGRVKKEYALAVYNQYIDPSEDNLRFEVKRIAKEKKALEKKRLDLDCRKKSQRRATSNEKRISSCHKVKLAQAEFDRQAELLQLMVDSVTKTQSYQLVYLKNLVALQKMYYVKCHAILKDLHNELGAHALETRL